MTTLIVGYYGYQNFGDEWLLRVVLGQILKKKETSKVFVAHRCFNRDGQITYVPRFSFKLLVSIFQSDKVIFGGGTLFQDKTSKKSMAYYTVILGLAKLCRKKVVWMGQGLGPLSPSSQKWLSWAMPKKAALAFRDQESAVLFKKCCPNHQGPIEVTKDLAFQSGGVSVNRGKLIGVSLRSEKNLALIRSIVNTLKQDKISLVANPEDEVAMTGVNTSKTVVLNNFLTESNMDWEGLSEALKGIDYVISMRYHVLVVAAMINVPFIALSNDPKITSLANQFKQPVVDLSLDNVKEQLASAVALVSKDTPSC